MADSVSKDDDKDLAVFIRQFQESADITQSARAKSELCRDYVDGKQWTDTETKKLTKRGQPVITDNRIKDKIEHWLGMELSTRTDPHAYPRNPQDVGAADAATDALRYIADDNHFPQVKSGAFENMLVEGTGGCEVIIEQIKGKPCVRINRIRWDRMYWDAHSMLADFSDARFMGIVVWLDVADAKKKYPTQAVDFDALMAGTFDFANTYDDKPNLMVDRTRSRVQILEHYFNNGDGWKRVVFSRVGIIEAPADSPYLDEYGDPECPLIFQSAYVARDGNRYGVVPRYIPLQDEINHRRSKALHLLSSRQVIAEKGAVADVNKARQELARPDGWVEHQPGMKVEISQTNDLAMGQFNILQDTLASLAASGPNSALQGQEATQSGRSQQVAQQAGVVQLGPVLDGLRYWQNRVMRACWNRVKQYWTEETWIRVTDNEVSRFIALNQRVTRGEAEAQKLKGQPPEVIQARVQELAADPASLQEVVLNKTSDLDVDIVIDEAPDTVTLQSEQWLQLTELAKNGVPIKPETLIKASNLSNKDELIDDIKQSQQGNAALPPEVQQQLQQMVEQLQQKEQELAQREQALAQQEQALKSTSADIKTQMAGLTVAEAEVETQRKLLALDVKVAQATVKARDAAQSTQEQATP